MCYVYRIVSQNIFDYCLASAFTYLVKTKNKKIRKLKSHVLAWKLVSINMLSENDLILIETMTSLNLVEAQDRQSSD